MANLFPSLPHPRTKGEQKIIQHLTNSLDNTWYIFYEPIINQKHPDLILFSPFYGVMVVEIKDYTINTFIKLTPDYWTITANNIKQTVLSPLKQVKNYSFDLIHHFKKTPVLVNSRSKSMGKLFFPITICCMFPNLTKSDIKLLNLNKFIPEDILFCKEDLLLNKKLFTNKLTKIFQNMFTINPLNEVVCDTIISSIYPTMHVKMNKENSNLSSENSIQKNRSIHKKKKCIISVNKFNDIIDELIFIANEIKHLINIKKTSLSDISVCFPYNYIKNERYLNTLIYDIFKDLGIKSKYIQTENREAVNILPLNSLLNAYYRYVFIIDTNHIGLYKKEITAEALSTIACSSASHAVYFTHNNHSDLIKELYSLEVSESHVTNFENIVD
ncbi:nuclease-related domain-containing protein [Bacillus mycoides]|uniref:nuclease-related domain-containing protein n=1 Tax=Bacillus mycoides TaxID=1405 RepID=UPI001C012892|nr:nuclease-related domain-containing protein [Bacillus mycoides]